MKSLKKIDRYKLIMSIIPLGFVGVFAAFEHFVKQYGDIDNFLISMVLNGAYSEQDNYTFFVHPLTAVIVKGLSKVFRYADGYLLLVWVCVLLSLYFLVKGILKFFERDYKRALLTAGAVTVIYGALDTVHSNFTVLTAVLALSGSLLILMGTFNDGYEAEVYEGVFVWFTAFLFRQESALIMLMFFGISLLFKAFSFSKTRIIELLKRHLIPVCLFVLMFIAMIVSKFVTVSSERYRGGMEYSNLRSSIVDYYEGGYHYLHYLMDTENMNETTLSVVLDGFKAGGTRLVDPNPLKGFVKNYLSSYTALMILLLICLLMVIVLGFSKEKTVKWSVCVSFIVGMAFIGACYLQGRAPERILLLFQIGMLIGLVDGVNGVDTIHKSELKSLAIWALLLVPIVFLRMDYTVHQNEFTARTNNEDLAEYRTDGFYVWDVFLYDVNVMYPYMEAGKLFPEELIEHNIPDGEWIYGQPYFEDFLKKIGHESPMDSLFNDDNSYYVAYSEGTELVIAYRTAGNEYEIVQNGDISKIPVNKFVLR